MIPSMIIAIRQTKPRMAQPTMVLRCSKPESEVDEGEGSAIKAMAEQMEVEERERERETALATVAISEVKRQASATPVESAFEANGCSQVRHLATLLRDEGNNDNCMLNEARGHGNYQYMTQGIVRVACTAR